MCFGQFLCPPSGVFHCTHSKPVWHKPLLCVQWKTPDDGQRNCPKHVEQDQDGTAVPSWSCSQAVSKPLWHIPLLCIQWKAPDDGQRNCPKHVQFYSKKKFEKLVHTVGFIIRIITTVYISFYVFHTSDLTMTLWGRHILPHSRHNIY